MASSEEFVMKSRGSSKVSSEANNTNTRRENSSMRRKNGSLEVGKNKVENVWVEVN
jgi:hypothetical protein